MKAHSGAAVTFGIGEYVNYTEWIIARIHRCVA